MISHLRILAVGAALLGLSACVDQNGQLVAAGGPIGFAQPGGRQTFVPVRPDAAMAAPGGVVYHGDHKGLTGQTIQGDLTATDLGGNRQRVHIKVWGGRGDGDIEGEAAIRGGMAVMTVPYENFPACVITITPPPGRADDIRVTESHCMYFHGAPVEFAGPFSRRG